MKTSKIFSLLLVFNLLSNSSFATNMDYTQRIQAACEETSKLNFSRERTAQICECVGRNHQNLTSPELLPVVERSYKDTLTEEDESRKFISILWDFDEHVAEACIKDPKHIAQKQ